MAKSIAEHIHRINYLAAELDGLYHQAAVKLGLSDSVMHIMYMLYDNDGSCMLSDICRMSGISKQTVNSAVRKLEGEELIHLEKQGGKMKKVCMTQKGREYAEQTVTKVFRAETEAYSAWSEEEINMHLKLMEKYVLSFRDRIEELQTTK